MRVLVTRPEPDASRTARSLRVAGHEPLVASLMSIETVPTKLDGSFAAVLMTSANAARAVALHPRAAELRRLACFTVGARTAEAARVAGFAAVESAEGALPDLVRRVAARMPGSRLVYLAGEDRAGDLGADLAAQRISVETAVIYRAAAARTFPAEAATALAAGEIDAVLHYSRRSAETVLSLAEAAGVLNAVLSLAHYCLSADVAGPLREAGAGRVTAATVPTEAALFALIPD